MKEAERKRERRVWGRGPEAINTQERGVKMGNRQDERKNNGHFAMDGDFPVQEEDKQETRKCLPSRARTD